MLEQEEFVTFYLSRSSSLEVFNNIKGVFVPVSETVRSFKEILEGKYDDLPEQAFLYVGTIEDAVKKAQMLKEEK